MNAEWAEPPKDQGRNLAAPGVQLAAQREAMGLSVEQIADQLKLAPRQVVALEAGDYASLPNMAVVRGFVRAYAKVVKLDPTPLVAMIPVGTPTPTHDAPPLRRELPATTFSESRFPTLTERSSKPTGLIVGAVAAVIVVAAGAYAWHSGMISQAMFSRASTADAPAASASAAASAPVAAADGAASAPLDTTLVKPGQESTTLQSPSVPLISVPPPAGTAPTPAPVTSAAAAAGATTAPATAAVTPATTTAAVSPPAATPAAVTPPAAATVATAAAAPAPAAAGPGHALVLKVSADSWITIRRPAGAPLISRLVKAGSTETFDIKEASLLIVGNPAGVQATLDGAPLALPALAGGTTSRVNIK